MDSFSETGTGVPPFLSKLWRLVEDPETNNLICWSKDGRSFIIQNSAQFARELLPLNYKHNNMASFIRQLNLYGFHKITSLDNGGLRFDRDEMIFTHPCFKKNCAYLMEHIKRKIASTKSVDEKSPLKPEAVTKVLQDVKAMRGRQDSLDSRFSVMKQENEALWREIASLRQKHAKQQQIVNKLIQFLITIVQPQRNMTSVKRHMQLMIDGIPDNSKVRKNSEPESESGPVIHELGEELMEAVSEVEPEIDLANSPFPRVNTPATPVNYPDAVHSPNNMERLQSSVSAVYQNFEVSNESAEDSCGYISPSDAIGDNIGLVHTVDNDGSKIFFHITEVPDAHLQEENISPVSYNEDNVLTTPMVREQMARSQLLKQNNRQRRIKNAGASENDVKANGYSSSKVQRIPNKQLISQKQQQQQEEQAGPQIPVPIQIKSEQEGAIDPMLFLNVDGNNRCVTPDPNLVSLNFSEDSRHSNTNITGSFLPSPNTALTTENEFLSDDSSDLYNSNNFIVNAIPADIFEDNSLTSVDENSRIGRNGKTSKYSPESTSENTILQPSTSAAAAAAINTSIANSNNNNKSNEVQKTLNASPPHSTLKKEYGRGKALTKYTNNQNPKRLSTTDEVSEHLDSVQDELESLKDLLRNDVCSLDNNTLLSTPLNVTSSAQNAKCNRFENNNLQIYLPPTMEEDVLNKLFTDADILGPYGLQLSPVNDGSEANDKKGSELMTYQPMYDLSDIINDQRDLDTDANMPTTSSTLPVQQQSKQEFSNSVLNTPFHE